MPNREDEFWAAQKEPDLRYCDRHKRYYDAQFGCQRCWLENKSPVINEEIQVTMIRCPHCTKDSLSWIEKSNQYECFNRKCRWTYTKEQLAEEIKLREEEPKGKAWFGNMYFDAKKKKWRKP